MHFDYDALISWFDQSKRDFPWRKNPSAYAVWVSEVMLQQTRAAAVVPYFSKWMEAFPDLSTLAKASWEQVIKMWEGLGYYQRARNLHAGARLLVEKHQGNIPDNKELLQKIPGIGPYTVNAILSFAFQRKKIAVDANVKRVLARYFAIAEDLSKKAGEQKLQAYLAKLEKESPHCLAEPLIELGALVCQKNPLCHSCPLQNSCLARQKKEVEKFPFPVKKQEILSLQRVVHVLEHQGKVLLRQEREKKLFQDLYEFAYEPYIAKSLRKWEQSIQQDWGMQVLFLQRGALVKQSFTRYIVTLHPLYFQVKKAHTPLGYTWVARQELKHLPFSSGHKKILQEYLSL